MHTHQRINLQSTLRKLVRVWKALYYSLPILKNLRFLFYLLIKKLSTISDYDSRKKKQKSVCMKSSRLKILQLINCNPFHLLN